MKSQFGEAIALFTNRAYLQIAVEYRDANPAWFELALSEIRRRRLSEEVVNIRSLRQTLPPTETELEQRCSEMAEYLYALEEQRLLLSWLVSRTDDEIHFDEPQEAGQYVKYLHDSVFVQGYSLVDKAQGVVTGTAIRIWGRRLSRSKSSALTDYRDRFKSITGRLENLRHSYLHGQGGIERPDGSALTEEGLWKYILVTGAWPPAHPMNFLRYRGNLSGWMAQFRPAAEGTANQVGEILIELGDELGFPTIPDA